jgi:hypothetical protein
MKKSKIREKKVNQEAQIEKPVIRFAAIEEYERKHGLVNASDREQIQLKPSSKKKKTKSKMNKKT